MWQTALAPQNGQSLQKREGKAIRLKQLHDQCVFDMWMILEYFITYDRNIGQVKPSAGPCWHLQSPPRAWHMVCTVETNWVVMQGKQVATLSFEILLHLFCLNICVDWSRLQMQSRSKNLNEIARPQVFLKLLASVKFRLWQWHLWHRKQVMSVIAMLCQSVTRCIFLQADLCTFTLFFWKLSRRKLLASPQAVLYKVSGKWLKPTGKGAPSKEQEFCEPISFTQSMPFWSLVHLKEHQIQHLLMTSVFSSLEWCFWVCHKWRRGLPHDKMTLLWPGKPA